MSISTRLEAINQHLLDDYGVLTLAGADLTNVDKNIINLKQTWEERLLYFINNGTSVVWNNWNKVQGSGYTLTLNNTLEAPMTIEYKGNTSQGENPTPTTPQDIHIVSGDNSIMVSNSDNTQSQTYPIYLPVENYLPNNATTQTINGITYTINEDKSIKINGTASGRADLYLYGSSSDNGEYLYIPKGNYTLNIQNITNGTMFYAFREKTAGTRYQTNTNNGVIELLAQQDCYFYGIMLGVESGKTINNLTFYPQIEKGTKLNSYTPYGTTPIELCKIGTYQDYIYKEGKKWYLHKEIGKVVLNGSESWNYIAPTVSTDYAYFVTTTYDSLIKINEFNGLSNRFINYGTYLTPSKTVNSDCFSNSDGNANLRFYINKTTASDVATWKTWLSTHNTIVYYVLNTPTYEKITDTTLLNQLEAIKKSYENQTNINQENNDLPFELEVGALEKY